MSSVLPILSIEKAFLLIEIICEKGPLGATELAKLSKLNKTTAFRILSTLSTLGYLSQDKLTKKYNITLKFLKISSKSLSDTDIIKYAKPHLKALSDLTGETVHLVERSGNEIIYIDKYENFANSVRMVSRVGISLPMIRTAVGKALMAKLSDDETEDIWKSSEIIKKTQRTITDLNEFKAELKKVKENGYATDIEENEEGVSCVAAAVCDIKGKYKYAVSVSAPSSRMTEENIRKTGIAVLKTARELSET